MASSPGPSARGPSPGPRSLPQRFHNSTLRELTPQDLRPLRACPYTNSFTGNPLLAVRWVTP